MLLFFSDPHFSSFLILWFFDPLGWIMTTTTAQLLLNLEQCQVNCLVNNCAGITSRVWTQGDLSNKDASQTMFAIGWVCPAVYPRTRLKPVFKAQIFSSSSLPMPQHSTVRTRSVRATKITKSICQLSPLEECREDFGHAHFLEDVRVLRHGFKTRKLLSCSPAWKSMPWLPPKKYSDVRNLPEMIKDEVKIVSVHSWSLARILHNKTDDLNNKWNQEMLQGKQQFAVL